MAFDSEKHHRRSLRIKNRDYSKEGYYFMTICARNRENIFADCCVGAGQHRSSAYPGGSDRSATERWLAPTPVYPDNDRGQPQGLPLHKKNTPTLLLTAVGQIIKKNWRKITDQNVKTDAFVIMPNHIHGIIIIKSQCLCVGVGLAPTPENIDGNGQPQGLPLHKDNAPTPENIDENGYPRGVPLHKENAPTPKLGSIIGAFKSRCSMDYLKYIDENHLNESAKIWQRNYYEHIIRDRKELAAIRKYIKSNPANWAEDKENPLNL